MIDRGRGPALGCALLLAVLAAPLDARADTTVWGRAAQPDTFARDVLVEKVDALINEFVQMSARTIQLEGPARQQTPFVFRKTQVLHRARRLLERAEAASSDDVRLRLRLADVYRHLYDLEGDREQLEKSILHDQWALGAPLPTTTKANILKRLAVALAMLGRYRDEGARYDQAIAIEPDPFSQSLLRSNQAEGLMAQGLILKAIRGYRAALEVMPSALKNQGLHVSTLWGLATALDRSGDLSGALEHIERARQFDPFDHSIFKNAGWFFVPPYDEDWYAALGHWQRARAIEQSDDDRVAAYDEAIVAWRSYMNRAPMEDPWLPLAAVRLRTCEREREDARRRADRPRRKGRGHQPAEEPRWPD